MTKHIYPYIDKLRALAMLLVVMGHCIYFSMHHEQAGFHDPVFSVICTFHVPLFFFLSGIVIKQPPTLPKFLGKSRRFLTPMLVVGLVNALLIERLRDFFLNSGHNGYWYLLMLTLFYLMLLPFQCTARLKGVKGFAADVALAFALWLIAYIVWRINSPWIEPLNPWGTFYYWPFFVAGHIVRKHQLTGFLTGKPWSTALLLTAYIALLVLLFPHIDALPLVLEYTLALLAVGALLGLFHAFSGSNTFVDRQLLLIGNSTLDIYIYHYFFIRFINLDFLCHASLAVELAVIVPLTIAIAYASVGIGRLVDLLKRRV